MSFLNTVIQKLRHLPQKGALLLLALFGAMLPTQAYAAGGENVVLKFSEKDMLYLYLSLAFGVIALVVGFALKSQIRAMSPGDEKMQEVGKAIRDGALAYLKQQVSTMIWFVLVLGGGLFAMYYFNYNSVTLGALIALTFLLGVAASYIAGYVGMIAAVEGNMRTANAALTSYAKALQVAFRSGAVAGLITVGMGLLGATIIMLFFKEEAMKLLVGFGFGGSLAALFMRVGGGIFTKAADVGADLVGKVEAGIPEDDPRNPAVIADNVGDNVGDCAGMAADVFESYEVTLVAAIVLGAATAAIFDTSTWMKLVLFALMARGVGIIASIIGILTMKGSDDVNSDPLKFIRRGFITSAAVAVVGTAGVAWYMMGGPGSGQPLIKTTQFVTAQQSQQVELDAVRAIRDRLAKDQKVEAWRITADQVTNIVNVKRIESEIQKAQNLLPGRVTVQQIFDSQQWKDTLPQGSTKSDEVQKQEIEAAMKYQGPVPGIEAQSLAFTVQSAMQPLPENQPKPVLLQGYSKIDFKDASNPVLGYTAMSLPTDGTAAKAVSFKEAFSKDGKGEEMKPYKVFQLKVTPVPNPNAAPSQQAPRTIFFGPSEEAELDKQIENAKTFATIEKLDTFEVNLYSNAKGDVVMGVESVGVKGATLGKAHQIVGSPGFTFFPVKLEDYQKLEADRTANPSASIPTPPSKAIAVAAAEHKTVAWYLFFLAILFGVAMAFAIELLTDYYVSTHKQPVQEVAGVSTAGPAPMIISGFALALESSVFSVFAIVVALLFPMFLFPPAEFGGYILSFYGISLVGLGLLTTTGYILAMDTFGPISDNAQGVFEMSGAGHDNPAASKGIQRLDAAGNTTKALTKGFAIATAVVAAVALFHSYVEGARLTGEGLRLDLPEIFLGLLIGGAAPFLFSAFSINAVGRASFELINEVRDQFRNDPGIMAGTSKPNYGKCVAIVTAAAQRELLGPGILAIALPMAVAFGFSLLGTPVTIDGNEYNLTGAQALGGFLAGCILSGQLMAVLLANSGGIWDNAKKLIEDGLYGGKGTEAHKAGVVCDTVGDPFKDTAGPALNPLIKVMNLVALLMAPYVIKPYGQGVLISITVACLALLAFSIWWSKRSSMSSALSSAAAGETALPADSAPEAPKKRITVEDEPSDN